MYKMLYKMAPIKRNITIVPENRKRFPIQNNKKHFPLTDLQSFNSIVNRLSHVSKLWGESTKSHKNQLNLCLGPETARLQKISVDVTTATNNICSELVMVSFLRIRY